MYNYILDYAICSFIFLSLIVAHYFSKPQFKNIQNKLFSYALVFALADISLDIISSYMIDNYVGISPVIQYAANTLFFMIQVMFPALMLLYIMAVLGILNRKNLKYILLSLVPAFLLFLLLMVNLKHPIMFYFDDTGYHRCELWISMYIMCGLYIAAALVLINKYRAKLPRSYYVTIMLFVIATILAVGIQYIFPRYLLTDVAIALSMCMVYLIMNKPEHMLDTLTGVFNREALMLTLKDRIKENKPYQIILVEVNHIRRINNLFGYTTGNVVLQSVAQYFADNSDGWTFRLISNQFIIITEDANKHAALLKAIQKRFTMPWQIQSMTIVLSGTVLCIPQTKHIRSGEEMLQLLETMLPAAEKGEILALDEYALNIVQRSSAIERALLEALDNDALDVHYQPIFSRPDNNFISAEALVRFNHSDMGSISPDEFIPIAEKNGLIFRVDEAVMRNVCRFIKEFEPQNTIGLKSLEINLSAAEFVQQELPRKISDIIDEYGVDYGMLLFEITETAATIEYDLLKRSMQTLTEKGFRFALDDYGSGYANITQVMKLPFSSVKMDRSMLIAREESVESEVMFKYTANMLSEMGFTTIVEGVETAEQAQALNEVGVQYMQGYYFAKPMPAPQFIEFMKEYNASRVV